MKEKIFKALKSSVLVGGKTSLSDETITLYLGLIDSEKITDESQIAEAIKPVVPLLKAAQANINSVAASVATAKESELKAVYETKIKELEKPSPDQPKEKTDFEKMLEQYTEKVITPLTQTIQSMQGEKILTSRLDLLKSKLEDAPAPYRDKILKDFKRLSFKDDNDFNEYLEETVTDKEAAKQEFANNGFKETVPPGQGNPNPPSDGEAFANMIKEGTKEIVEQQKK